jgi:hypothetical protein
MWDTKDILLMITALVGGFGGLGALLRARGQNRVDQSAQLTNEQVKFREHMAGEIGRLDQALAAAEKRGDDLAALVQQGTKDIAALQQQNLDQAKQIDKLTAQNTAQAAQIAEQAILIEQITGEKAKAIHDAQVATSTKEFLERENGELRREVQRLKEQLPARIEVSPS